MCVEGVRGEFVASLENSGATVVRFRRVGRWVDGGREGRPPWGVPHPITPDRAGPNAEQAALPAPWARGIGAGAPG